MLSVRHFTQAERRSFAVFLRELSDDDWQAPSLCAGWTVHDVVAHSLSFDDLTWQELLGRFGRARLWLAEVNASGVADYSSWEPDRLIARHDRQGLCQQRPPRGVRQFAGAWKVVGYPLGTARADIGSVKALLAQRPPV